MAFTPARVRKAILFRLRKFRAGTANSKPVALRSFASATALKEFALNTSETGQRFRFEVRHSVNELPLGVCLSLGNLKSAAVSLQGNKVTVDVSMVTEVSAGEVAWAVAALLEPGLLPTASSSRDVAVDAQLTPALAMGHRLVFGGFGTTDASAMEEANARRVRPEDLERPYFDLATHNPIGLRGTETASVGVNASAAEVAAVAATGKLLHVQSAPLGLNPELAAVLSQPLPNAPANHEERLHWLVRSAKQRRLAMLNHAGTWRLQAAWPTASVLLVTNRASLLPHALGQIEAQTYPEFEVLIGLHNIDEQEAERTLAPFRERLGSRLRAFHFGGEATLGAIYGELTNRADGVYLAKFDDDDHYGAHHLWDAIISLRYSGAGLFGRVPQLTWLEATGELLWRPFGAEEIYNKYVIGATMVMSKPALLEVGGWRPSPWAVDKALIDRFRQHGGGIYRASAIGWAYVRHNLGHTWEKDESHFRGQAEASWSGDQAVALRDLALER